MFPRSHGAHIRPGCGEIQLFSRRLAGSWFKIATGYWSTASGRGSKLRCFPMMVMWAPFGPSILAGRRRRAAGRFLRVRARTRGSRPAYDRNRSNQGNVEGAMWENRALSTSNRS